MALFPANFHHSAEMFINIKILFVLVMPFWRNSLGFHSWNTSRQKTAQEMNAID